MKQFIIKEKSWIQQLPDPIQAPLLCAYDDKLSPNERLNATWFSVYQIIRFSCCLFLPQMISSIKDPKELSPSLLSKISKSMTAIKAPTFMDWKILFETFVKNYNELKLYFPCAVDFNLLQKLIEDKKEINIQNKKITDIDLFRELRNTIAHSGMPNQEIDLKDLNYYLPVLEVMINTYFQNWMKDIKVVYLNLPKINNKLNNSVKDFYPDLNIDSVLCNSEDVATYVLLKDKYIVVYPWIFYHDSDNISKGIIDGFFQYKSTNNYFNLIYLDKDRRGLLRYEDNWTFIFKKPSDILINIFNRWKLSWDMNKEKTSFYSLKDPVDYNTREIVSFMVDSKKYIPEMYIERHIVDFELAQFCFGQKFDSKYRAVHIGGDYGLGKSALLARLADLYLQDHFAKFGSRSDNQHILLYIRCDGMTVDRDNQAEDNLFKYAAPMLGVVRNNGFKSFADLFNHLEQQIICGRECYRFVILIDSINEASNPQYILECVCNLIVLSRKYDWIRIVFSIRSNYLEALLLKRQTGSGNEKNPLAGAKNYLAPCPWIEGSKEWKIPALSIMESRQLFANYKKSNIGSRIDSFDHLKPLWKEETGVLRNPLLFNFFMHANNEKNNELINTEEYVFDAWLNYKFESQDALWYRTKNIVSWLILNNKFFLDEIDFFSYREEFSKKYINSMLDPIELCISEGIMTKYSKNNQIQIQFSFEALGALLYAKFLYEGFVENKAEWFAKVLNLNKKKNFRPNSLLSLSLTILFKKILIKNEYQLYVSVIGIHHHIDNFLEESIYNFFINKDGNIKEKNKVLAKLVSHAENSAQRFIMDSLYPDSSKGKNNSLFNNDVVCINFLNQFEKFYSKKSNFSLYRIICAKKQIVEILFARGNIINFLKSKELLENCIEYHFDLDNIKQSENKVTKLHEKKSGVTRDPEDEIVFFKLDNISYSIDSIYIHYVYILYKLNPVLYSKEISHFSDKLFSICDYDTNSFFPYENSQFQYLLRTLSVFYRKIKSSDSDGFYINLQKFENYTNLNYLKTSKSIDLLNIAVRYYNLSLAFYNINNIKKSKLYGIKSLKIIESLPAFVQKKTERNLLIFWYKINNIVPKESQISEKYDDDEFRSNELSRHYNRIFAEQFIEDKELYYFLVLCMLGKIYSKTNKKNSILRALRYFKKSEKLFIKNNLIQREENFNSFFDLFYNISQSLFYLHTPDSYKESLKYIIINIDLVYKHNLSYLMKIRLGKSHLLLAQNCIAINDKSTNQIAFTLLTKFFNISFDCIDYLEVGLFEDLLEKYEFICDLLEIEYASFSKYYKFKMLIAQSKIVPNFPVALTI